MEGCCRFQLTAEQQLFPCWADEALLLSAVAQRGQAKKAQLLAQAAGCSWVAFPGAGPFFVYLLCFDGVATEMQQHSLTLSNLFVTQVLITCVGCTNCTACEECTLVGFFHTSQCSHDAHWHMACSSRLCAIRYKCKVTSPLPVHQAHGML